MQGYDAEIGRGRRRLGGDSGSSRESSSERPVPNRIASPTISEDGDTNMQPVADDDTPPPASRPLIRQALGFSSDQPPTSINTYEASPNIIPKRPVFLPGQEVPIPPQPPQEQAPKKPKRARKSEPYSEKIGKFRLQAYDATPSTNPPMGQGSGPYSSMYRGSAPSLNSGTSIRPVPYNPGPSVWGSAAPAPATTNTSNTLLTRVKPLGAKRTTANKQQKSGPSVVKDNSAQPARPSPAPNANSHDGSSSHDSHQRQKPGPLTETSARQHPPAQSSSSANHNSPHSHHQHSSNEPQHNQHSYSSEPSKPKALRMVTLLIQDTRSGTIDHQLAEVKVPLRPSDNPEDGFWADAKDITQYLQNGPSRIDGPARAYTMRGKYRQFILRVTANNVDEFIGANVVVQPDRTLDVVVEMLPPPGTVPPPPNIPPDLACNSYENDIYEHQPQGPRNEQGRKRENSISRDDYDTPDPQYRSQALPHKSARHSYASQHLDSRSPPTRASPQYSGQKNRLSPPRNHPIHELSQAQYTMSGPTSMTPRSNSPRSASPADNVSTTSHTARQRSISPYGSMSPSHAHAEQGKFIEAVNQLLQRDDDWAELFKLKAQNSVAAVIQEYEFVKQKCDTYRGRLMPSFSKRIEDHHIIQAYHTNEENYLQNCYRTLELYHLYGKNGLHREDPDIMWLVNDKSQPRAKSNLHKRILHRLEETHEQWCKMQQQQHAGLSSQADDSGPRQGPRVE